MLQREGFGDNQEPIYRLHPIGRKAYLTAQAPQRQQPSTPEGAEPWGDYNQLDLEHGSSRMHGSMTSPGFCVDRTHNLYRMPSDLQEQSEPIVKHLKQHLFN